MSETQSTTGESRSGGRSDPIVPAIEAKRLSKWYGQVAGLLNVDLVVPSGIVGLLGPNGAGKTTFMRLLTSQLRPSSGALFLFGQPVWDNPDALVRLGYCPEHDGLWNELSGREMLEACCKLGGLDASDVGRATQAALEAVDMVPAAERRLKTYSKGMRQRIKLAQAIATNPDVVVLDEPLTGCDPVARAAIISLVKTLGEAGKTIIVSSHVLHEVEAMTDQIVLIHKGQVLATGGIHELRDLIDEHPHTIRVLCDAPRRLAAALVAEDTVRSLELDGTALVIETPTPDACYPALARLAIELGINVAEITSPDDNLEAVFKYLTGGRH